MARRARSRGNEIAPHPSHALDSAKQGAAVDEFDSMSNRFGLVFLDLPINEHTIEARFRRLKECIFGLEASVVVTKVLGTRKLVYIDGKRFEDVMFWVPHPAKRGLGLSVLSYA